MNVATLKSKAAERCANWGPRVLRIAAIVSLAIGFSAMIAPHAAAQGCAMCYQNAASSGAQGRIALRHGILILLLPALSLFLGVFFLIYRRRRVTGAPAQSRRRESNTPFCCWSYQISYVASISSNLVSVLYWQMAS